MADPPAPAPSPKPPGDRLASYFENFFRGIIGIATLGASLTFSKIVESPVPPFHNYGFSPQSIQYLLATSWLLFVLALAMTSFFASALSLWRPRAVAAFGMKDGGEKRKVLWVAVGVAALLFGLVLAAFLMVGLVVAAYVGPVGWVAVGFTVVFGVVGFGCIVWQSPVEWSRWFGGVGSGERDAFEKGLRRSEGGRWGGGGGDGLTGLPTRQPSRQRPPERDDRGHGHGRSGSGDYAGGDRRYGRRDGGDDMKRYRRASDFVTDVNEPGIFGHGGMRMYDNGVREGLVMTRYD